MKKIVVSNKPLYFLGLTWLLYSVFFPLYKLEHYITVSVISLVVYIFIRIRTPNTEIELPEPPAPKSEQELNIERILNEGRAYVAKLEELELKINEDMVSYQVSELVNVSNKIFSHVSEHPEKIKDIKMFMNYYLPTTVNIIKSYIDLSVQSTAQSKDIKEALDKIRKMLKTSLEGFNNLHSSLFTEKVMDVSADITVMEDLMEQHGLLEQKVRADNKNTKSDDKGNTEK